jgi:hypothetical protein
MSLRVKLTIINNSNVAVKCTDTKCAPIAKLQKGTIIPAKGKVTFLSDTNDRIFATFEEGSPGRGSWWIAATCPLTSSKSACGSINAGLQKYHESGKPAHYTFILGQPNLADWDDGSSNNGDVIQYGACSKL